MSLSPSPTARLAGGPSEDRWHGLMTLIRVRLLVATLALPVGVLVGPESTHASWWVLWWALLAIGALSVLFWLGVRLRRGIELQTYLQGGVDLLLVTGLTAVTGGSESQFVPLFALVVIAGGLLGRLRGGLIVGAAACVAFISLPWISRGLDAFPAASNIILPSPGLLVAFLAMMGVLAGALGERVRRTRDDLERTARELDRVRVDNDAILRHLTTGVFTVDGQGHVAYLNPAAEQVLGLRTLEARGRSIHHAMPERLWSLRDLVNETLEKHAPRARAEISIRTQAGRALPLGISTNLLTHEGSATGVVAVFQDLTEVREMERRARRNETLAEVGALAATIAHELRNGLNPISGSVECLQREIKVENENAVLMELIVTECNRLNRFVTDLLSYSRPRSWIWRSSSPTCQTWWRAIHAVGLGSQCASSAVV
jgi:two-component system sensor histidine kinase PilS (NtrC family)